MATKKLHAKMDPRLMKYFEEMPKERQLKILQAVDAVVEHVGAARRLKAGGKLH
ncbi:MAG: hypothetical protein AB2796_02535 [Candidatus Thiodiazotropha sp.]